MESEPTTCDLTHEQQADILNSIIALMEEIYAFPEDGKRACSAIQAKHAAGAYQQTLEPIEFAETVTRDLQTVTLDTHLRLVFDPRRVRTMQAAQAGGDRRDVSQLAVSNNHGFASVSHLKGNIGLVDIRHFFPPAIAGRTAAAAMQLVADTDAIIIDLRHNTGGNPGMVQFLCSYFFDGTSPVHLNTIASRPDKTSTQYWTLPYVPGKRLSSVPLYILTSGHTFSGGEAFAYHMAHLHRATLVGETTAGGANPAGIRIISDSFYAAIPHAVSTNPITRSNWEGAGVSPHVVVSADQAQETAHLMALDHLADETQEDVYRRKLAWWREEIESSHRPISITRSQLDRLTGIFGDVEVSLDDVGLVYRRRFFKYRLRPLSDVTFWLDGPNAGFESRVQFQISRTGKGDRIVGLFPDGRQILHPRSAADSD